MIPSCRVHLPPCSYSKILSSFFFLQPHLTHVMRTVRVCCSVTGLSQRTAAGWAAWNMQQMRKQDVLLSQIAAGDVWPSRVISGFKYCCILQDYLFCVLKFTWAGCFMESILSYSSLKWSCCPFGPWAFMFWLWVCWVFLPVDINKSVWWCISEICLLSL